MGPGHTVILGSVLWLHASMSYSPSWKQMARDLKKHSPDPWGQTRLSPLPTWGSLSGLYPSSTSVGPLGWSMLFSNLASPYPLTFFPSAYSRWLQIAPFSF